MILTFDPLTSKVVCESRVTWATSVPILVFLGLSVLELGPMYATDRQTSDVRQKHRLMPPPIRGGCIITSDKQSNIRPTAVESKSKLHRSCYHCIFYRYLILFILSLFYTVHHGHCDRAVLFCVCVIHVLSLDCSD